MPSEASLPDHDRGWRSALAVTTAGLLLLLTLSGLGIWLLPFSMPVQLTVIVHTAGGLALVLIYAVYQWRHWSSYRAAAWTHVKLTGYLSLSRPSSAHRKRPPSADGLCPLRP